MGEVGRWGDMVDGIRSRVGTTLVRTRILDQQKLRRQLVWLRAFKLHPRQLLSHKRPRADQEIGG